MTDPTPEQIQQIEQTVNAAAQDPNVPKFYANGFHIGQSASDVFIVPLLVGRPLGVQYMSFTTAKALMLGLKQVLDTLETLTGQKVLSIEDIQSKMTPGVGT